MVNVAKQLQNNNFRFIKLKKNDKIPIEKDWTNINNYIYNDEQLLNYNGNVGIVCGIGNLLVIDFDDLNFQEKYINKFPDTLMQLSGSGKKHLFFLCDDSESFKILDEQQNTLCDIQAKGKQIVVEPSIHPNGQQYKFINNLPISKIQLSEIKAIFSEYINIEIKNNYQVENKPSLTYILNNYSIDTTKNPTKCLWHSSKGGKCFSFSEEKGLWNCFHCNKGGDVISFVMHAERCNYNQALVKLGIKKEFDYTNIPSDLLNTLKNPSLFNDITKTEFDKKIVGEIETRQVIFLCAAGGRLVINAQIASYNLLVNDEAGAGKDYICNAVLEILPKDTFIHKTRISPTVFTYWHNSKFEPEWTWDGKVFYPEDISEQVLNSDVFKVMASKGSSATIVIKQVAVEIEIKGKPVMITTTANATPNPELTRRLVILNLDSSEKQTSAIMKRHSEFKKNGLVPDYDPKYTDAMKYLKRIKVKIPFADLIDKHFPINNIIMRTHYPRFLDYICASAAFHQYQRELDNYDYVLATKEDYDLARNCFLKLCSNKYMIPLTINQKKILELFEKEPLLKGSVSNLHSSKMSFIALKNLQYNLQILVKYGILETNTETTSANREIEAYSLNKSYKPNEKISIPKYDEIIQNDVSVVKGVSKVNDVNDVNCFINKTNNLKDIYPVYDVYGEKRIEETNILDYLKSLPHGASDVMLQEKFGNFPEFDAIFKSLKNNDIIPVKKFGFIYWQVVK